MAEEIIRELARVARQGVATARLARGLAGSSQGQLVMAWLGQVVATPGGGAERDRAVRILHQAAGWYLDRFRDGGQGRWR